VNAAEAILVVVERLSDTQIQALVQACDGHEQPTASLPAAVSGSPPASQHAVNRLADAWRSTPGLTGAGVAVALRTALVLRERSDTARARVVWTGPGSSGAQRLTAAALQELLSGARQRILIVSFAAHTLGDVAGALEDAVARGCAIDVVFETEDDSSGAYSGPNSTPFGEVAGIHRWHWPSDQRQAAGVLHAKVLVIDGRRALVGSANLTYRALHDNLEAGILVEDPALAASIERHIRSLMESGVLRLI
jgi:phosphatidylserine/phosphatidylglycerophosphate/cardiolipin synthase-like enzyme